MGLEYVELEDGPTYDGSKDEGLDIDGLFELLALKEAEISLKLEFKTVIEQQLQNANNRLNKNTNFEKLIVDCQGGHTKGSLFVLYLLFDVDDI